MESHQLPGLQPSISVVILDDNLLLLESLGAVLAGTPGFSEPRLFSDPAVALTEVTRCPPTVLIVDLHLPSNSGLRFMRNVRKNKIDCPILVLTESTDWEEVVAAIQEGATGYLLKTNNLKDVVTGLRKAAAGEPAVSEPILSKLISEYRTSAILIRNPPNLTPREARIVELTGTGLSCRDVADELGINIHTVYAANKQIASKLKVSSRPEAAARWRTARELKPSAPHETAPRERSKTN